MMTTLPCPRKFRTAWASPGLVRLVSVGIEDWNIMPTSTKRFFTFENSHKFSGFKQDAGVSV